MSASPQPVPFSKARWRASDRAPDAVTALLAELGDLARIEPKLVAAELQPLVESLRARRKTCYRCASDSIGKRAPKRGQRTFCSPECGKEQASEDFSARGSPALSER